MIVGSSRKWAVWGWRSWEVALLWSVGAGPWLDLEDVPLMLDARTAMEAFAGSWGTMLEQDEVEAFVRNVKAFGCRL